MDRENRHDEWNREFSVVPEIIFFWETVPSFELHDSLIFEGIVEWIENVGQSEWIMYTDMHVITIVLNFHRIRIIMREIIIFLCEIYILNIINEKSDMM